MTQSPSFEILILLLIAAAVIGVLGYSLRIRKQKPASNPYLEALELMVDGQERLAIQKLKEAIRMDTENVEAYIRLGDLLRRKRMFDHAIRIHKDLTYRGNLTPSQRVQVLKSLLLDYYFSEAFLEGIEVAQKILELDKKGEAVVYQKLLEMYEKTQNWKAAFEISKKYLDTKNPEIRRRLALYQVFEGIALQNKGLGKEARVKFKEALKQDPRCVAAYYYLGKSYFAEERLDDAVEQWKRLCQVVPEKAYIVFPELERTWFEMGRFVDAENLYLDLYQKDEKNSVAGLALAWIHAKKGEYDRALEILTQVEENSNIPEQILANRFLILFEKGQYKLAAAEAKKFFEEKFALSVKFFKCHNCDYSSKQPFWICPKCKSIDSASI